MKISQIYTAYMIPKNLQEHMLRTASFAMILLENWIGESVEKEAIVQACVLHDIAKPMDFDLAKQAQFGMSQDEIDELEKLQIRLKRDYGDNEHQATVKICKKVGCTSTAVILVNNLKWSYVPRLMAKNDILSLIPIYCDMRIGPKGILSLDERIEDLKKREGNKDSEEKATNGRKLEALVTENTSLDLNSITDD